MEPPRGHGFRTQTVHQLPRTVIDVHPEAQTSSEVDDVVVGPVAIDIGEQQPF